MKILIYNPPNEKTKSFVKIVESSGTGTKFRRLRFYRGKDRNGFAWSFMPDKAYYNIDAWTQKYGLPPLQFCLNTWMDQRIVSFTEMEYEPPRMEDQENPSRPNPQVAWDTYKHMKQIRKEALACHLTAIGLRSKYTSAQRGVVEDFPNILCAKIMKNGAANLSSEPEARHIVQNEVHTVDRSLCVAANLIKTEGRAISQFSDKIFEREKYIQDYLCERFQPPPIWDGICELFQPPREIRHFFNNDTVDWFKLNQETKSLFMAAIKGIPNP